uniref:Uncharacterized protein n=1 Tax=Rhodnius prolixus TaxID=13249 RepID=T1HZD2_RHOPR
MRLTIFWVIYSLIGYCFCRPIEDKLMTLLKGMSEEQLARLEEKLASLLLQDEQMLGDMPLPTNESDSNLSNKERIQTKWNWRITILLVKLVLLETDRLLSSYALLSVYSHSTPSSASGTVTIVIHPI